MKRNLKHCDWILEARSVGPTLAALALVVALGAAVAPAQLAPGCHLDLASQIMSCHTLYAPPAASYSLLYSFQCSTDGDTPEAGLVRDAAGNLSNLFPRRVQARPAPAAFARSRCPPALGGTRLRLPDLRLFLSFSPARSCGASRSTHVPHTARRQAIP